MNQTHARIQQLEQELTELKAALTKARRPLPVGMGDVLCPTCKMRYGLNAWEKASGQPVEPTR